MKHVVGLRCLICERVYTVDEIDYVCPDHGADGIVDVLYDYDYLRSQVDRGSLGPDRSMWRYRPLLPIEDGFQPPLAVGWTPLYEAPRMAAEFNLGKVWVKDDGRQPTASFKDRASAVAVVKARERNAAVITTASTGNAAAALAGICASVEQPNVIFVPESAPQAKIAQLLVFGSVVLLVRGTYDQAFELCLEAAGRYGWYNRNTGYNPYMSEGKKTAAYEICEQLGWNAPDAVFVSVGDGCIIGGLHKGFRDLAALGWIDHVPALVGVQAEGSNFLTEAWENSEDVLTKAPIAASTVADSISAGLPRDRLKAMRAVRETGGEFLAVTDDEILAAIPAQARGAGVFGEPAGAAAYAGLAAAHRRGNLERWERVVVVNTGSGLKDVAAAMRSVKDTGASHPVDPDMESVERAIEQEGLAP